MAVFTSHNLYPGVIDTAMPGFVVDEGQVKVYFNLSPNNSSSDVASEYLQVSLRYQNSNLNALNDPSGIVLKTMTYDSNKKQWYFYLYEEDLKDGEFFPYQYYKLQFRLTDYDASDILSGQTIDNWLSMESTISGKTNLDESSEWSTVCLIRGITEVVPTITLEGGVLAYSDTYVVNSGFSRVFGRIDFTAAEDGSICDEYLKSFHIQVYEISSLNNYDEEKLCYDSGDVYINQYQDINQFNCDINYFFKTIDDNDTTYYMKIDLVTSSLYKITEYIDFYVEESGSISIDPSFIFMPIEEEGLMGLSFTLSYEEARDYTYTIYRYDTYRKKVEKIYDWDFYTFDYGDAETIYYMADVTPESGILYVYYLVARERGSTDCSGRIYARPAYPQNIPGVFLDHIFLKQKNFQLKIKYNPNISSMKTVYSENKTDTLGSQFPYIKRNGAVKYRTFPISGLITHFMDEHNLATSREEIFGVNSSELTDDQILAYLQDNNNNNNNNSKAAAGPSIEISIPATLEMLLYGSGTMNANYINMVKNISEEKDYTYERLFRDKIMSYLENGKVFLFRSPTEGNILIRLTDVSLNPVETLGRMIWSFNATAYEVAECTTDNMVIYGIDPLISLDTGSKDAHGTDRYNPSWLGYALMAARENGAINYWADYNSKQDKLIYKEYNKDEINSYVPKQGEFRTDSLTGIYTFETEVPYENPYDDEAFLQ